MSRVMPVPTPVVLTLFSYTTAVPLLPWQKGLVTLTQYGVSLVMRWAATSPHSTIIRAADTGSAARNSSAQLVDTCESVCMIAPSWSERHHAPGRTARPVP